MNGICFKNGFWVSRPSSGAVLTLKILRLVMVRDSAKFTSSLAYNSLSVEIAGRSIKNLRALGVPPSFVYGWV